MYAKRFGLFDRIILAKRDRNCNKICGGRRMGSGRRNVNGGGEHVAAESAVPVAAEKVVQSVKEIVDCTEHEIYAVLEECDMDVNRTVEKLLSQGFVCSFDTVCCFACFRCCCCSGTSWFFAFCCMRN